MPYQIFRIDRAPEAKPIEAKRIERLLTKHHPVSEWAVRERTEEIATLKAEVERLKGCVLTQNKIIIMQMDEISTLKAKVVELEERLRVENRDVVSADEYATLKAELAKAKEQDYCTLCGESLDRDKQTVIDTLKARVAELEKVNANLKPKAIAYQGILKSLDLEGNVVDYVATLKDENQKLLDSREGVR